ncbi:Ldh family oxidoreductase [Lichenifustis flavocetrariae]|uniref:Ldh family oxidoreductase n=1 Tax=Lichenifustis flavocetrariae TaxID=2949735 RepID=A0AA41Z2P2_9HYPH|nr:Ldh family oxidoreductase [Lichenifustis flavocetrariae]MCW6509250.1 Ldh family oxidoreductase [Lichenifustis flavocetrariae]
MPSFDTLVAYAERLLKAAGLDGDKPTVTARLLVTADAMGHTTHGLAQLPDYIEDILAGKMTSVGEPDVVADKPAAVVWDGRRLPGVWLTDKAVRLAAARAKTTGICAVTIRRSHHIACLATFLPAATEQGLMVIVASSDPSDAHVAPFGGTRAVFTPDPLAVGIPTEGDPILIDISASITTAGMSARLRREGGSFPGEWALDADGRPSRDPNVLVGERKGTLLPAGGVDHGHKGYGLALMVEAITQGLCGYGRADGEADWGASVFVQVFDPALFGGLAAFTRQTEWVAEACRTNPPVDPARPVRLPGAAAMRGMRDAMANGLTPRPGLLEALEPWAAKLGITPLRNA